MTISLELKGDYRMGKKRDLANEHIELLIYELVDTRESNNRGYCCHSDERNKCIHDCETCKEKYFENMKENLREKYLVV